MIRSKPEDCLDDDRDWWENIGRFVEFCRGCGSMTRVYPRPLNAVVQNRQRGTKALSGCSGYTILKRPFFNLLAPYMPGVVTGEVRFGDGRVQKDSLTLNFPPEMALPLRGGHGSRARRWAYKTCEGCGERVSSLAILTNPIYALRREIPPGREVFLASGFMAISERLSKELDLTPFPDIRLQPIGVFDTPIEPVPELGDPQA